MTDQTRPAWFVGAMQGTEDLTERFISTGVWENGYSDRYLDLVREMRPGDRIAIKAAYTRKHGLPFETHGNTVSVMAIKAIGTVTENLGDGRHVSVDWEAVEPKREWYFFTGRSTVWKVIPGSDEFADALLHFTFDGESQDIELFVNHPHWVDRFGGPRAWLIRTGTDGKALFDHWLAGGFVSLAAAHLPGLEAGASKAEVESAISNGYDFVEYPQRRAMTEDYYAFWSLLQEDDAIVVRWDDRAWIGHIVGEPYFVDDAPRLRREVAWNEIGVPEEALPPEAATLPGSFRLVVDLTKQREAIEALFDEGAPVDPVTSLTLPRATDELAAAVYSPKEWLDDYISLLESRRQLIVYGPPGTGKTFVARKVARHIAGDNVRIVQFHPSYAYEDFFEGLRPVPAEGNVTYAVMPGPLSLLAQVAQDDPGHPYVLIIDEINRADIAKVFGELYYLLEYRGDKINLQYSPEKEFFLPTNLYFIGTMNTADRSIALVDAAIRRRFPFIEMHPSEQPVSGVLAAYLKSSGRTQERAELLAELNGQLTGKLREFQIGPSYLMRDEAATEEGLSRIWRYDILPLLEEQLYGTHDREQVYANFGLDAIRKAVARKGGHAEPVSAPVRDPALTSGPALVSEAGPVDEPEA